MNGPERQSAAWLFFTGPALCCAAASAATGLLTERVSFHLLAIATAAASMSLIHWWRRLSRRLRGLPSLFFVLGLFCLPYGALLAPTTQQVTPLVVLPARTVVIAAGIFLSAAGLISAALQPKH